MRSKNCLLHNTGTQIKMGKILKLLQEKGFRNFLKKYHIYGINSNDVIRYNGGNYQILDEGIKYIQYNQAIEKLICLCVHNWAPEAFTLYKR